MSVSSQSKFPESLVRVQSLKFKIPMWVQKDGPNLESLSLKFFPASYLPPAPKTRSLWGSLFGASVQWEHIVGGKSLLGKVGPSTGSTEIA